FIDHYLLLAPVRALHARAGEWLGEVQRVQVALLETQGVPAHQERSHAQGMANFYHHVVALAGLWLDLDDLAPAEGAWARHAEAGVTDTYRGAAFVSASGGQVVLEGAVGKYLPRARKVIDVHGSRGRARIDRERNGLQVTFAEGRSFWLPGVEGDTGYGELA